MLDLSSSARTTALAFGAALTGMAALGLASTDRMIGTSVKTELASQDRAHGSLPVAGSEAFWLSHATAGTGSELLSQAVAGSVAQTSRVSRAVAMGDRMTLTMPDGIARTLEVVEVHEVSGALLKVADPGRAPRLILVTCRDTTAGSGSRPIRFIVEVDERGQQPAKTGASDKVL